MHEASLPVLIDTHAHILMDDFNADREAALARARDAGVALVIDVGLDIETSRQALENARRFPGVAASIGFHPHDAARYDEAAFRDFLAAHAADAVCLGEFGLDYYRDRSPRPAQRSAFASQLALARELNMPVALHCRDAESDMLAMLSEAGAPLRGIMHCFPGDVDFMEKTVALGLHVAGGGPITYPRAERWERVLRAVPRGRFVLETDCPFLAPQARRGRRNEPALLPLIAARVAEIWRVPPEEVARVTTENASALFGPKAAAGMKNSRQ